jgi:hypothetical protein
LGGIRRRFIQHLIDLLKLPANLLWKGHFLENMLINQELKRLSAYYGVDASSSLSPISDSLELLNEVISQPRSPLGHMN